MSAALSGKWGKVVRWKGLPSLAKAKVGWLLKYNNVDISQEHMEHILVEGPELNAVFCKHGEIFMQQGRMRIKISFP